MTRNFILVLLLIVLATCTTLVHSAAANDVSSSIVIDDVQRTIDATKPNIVRQKIIIKVVNSGANPVEFFHFALPKEFGRNHLSFLKVTQEDKELKVTNYGYEDKNYSDAILYEIQLAKPIQSKQKVELTVNLALVNGITTPFPKEIEQSENQKLLYVDNAYFYSPYQVSSQKTTVELGTSIIDSYTSDIKPSERRGSSIVYGSFSNQKPFAYSKIRLHYQNNSPYVVVSKVERHIEISHWGNIAVEEQYDVRHGGAKFKGSFSRSDYARNPSQSAPASFRDLTAKLPPTAADVYFRDRIGNISTSTVRSNAKNVEVDFLPRFPLFGGWRIRFTIGYNIPTPPFLSRSGDKYKFVTKFSVPFDFAPVDDLSLKVVIPEGATDIKVFAPFPVDSEERDILKTYLDTTGRSVVIIKKTQLSPEHNQDITITYRFASQNILREPGLIIGALLALCLFMMAYVRFDLTIQKSESTRAEDRETKVAELTEEFIEKQMAVNSYYSALEQAIQRTSKDDSRAFDEEFNRISTIRNDLSNEISEILRQLTDLNATEVTNKIRNLLISDKNKFGTVQDLAKAKKDLAKSGDSKSRDQLAKTLKPLETKYDTFSDEVTSIMDQLSEY